MLRVRERKEAERALGVPSCVRERVSYHCGTLPVSFYIPAVLADEVELVACSSL